MRASTAKGISPWTQYCRQDSFSGFFRRTRPDASTTLAITICEANCRLLISIGAARAPGASVNSTVLAKKQQCLSNAWRLSAH